MKAWLFSLSLCVLSACGQTGPLVLPATDTGMGQSNTERGESADISPSQQKSKKSP